MPGIWVEGRANSGIQCERLAPIISKGVWAIPLVESWIISVQVRRFISVMGKRCRFEGYLPGLAIAM